MINKQVTSFKWDFWVYITAAVASGILAVFLAHKTQIKMAVMMGILTAVNCASAYGAHIKSKKSETKLNKPTK